MTQQPVSANQQRVLQLTAVSFVFHPWANLNIIVPDGVMCQIDTKRLDVDNENKGGGIGHLKRMRLLPLPTTTRPLINNLTGFSASNVMIGGQSVIDNTKGQPGLGYGLSGGGKRNVMAQDSPPEEKINDLTAAFGKYGLVGINSLYARDAATERRAQEIFAVVTDGLDDRTLLEDVPEFFGIDNFALPDKRPRGLAKSFGDEEFAPARWNVEAACSPKGLSIAPRPINIGDPLEAEGYATIIIGKSPIKLTETEKLIALNLIGELISSFQLAEAAAIGAADAILPMTREGRETGQKKSFDGQDRWLMAQYPSFPMGTEIEKANSQLMRALDRESEVPAVSGVPVEVYLAEKQRNDDLMKEQAKQTARMDMLEKKFAAT